MPAPLITKENAKEMSAKANQIRWDNWRKNRDAKLVPIKLEVMPDGIPAPDVQEELQIVNEQIAHAREALNDKTPWCPVCERPELQPHHRAQLLKALDTLLDRRRILSGRPLPGSRKPAPDRPIKRNLVPTPQPVVDEEPRPSNPDEPNG